MYFCPLVSLKCCEQKRLTRKMRIAFVPPSKCPATVEVMIDFPVPASPVNQKIRRLLDDESWAHWYMGSSMVTRVPEVHGSWVNVFGSLTPALYSALRARGKLSSRNC